MKRTLEIKIQWAASFRIQHRNQIFKHHKTSTKQFFQMPTKLRMYQSRFSENRISCGIEKSNHFNNHNKIIRKYSTETIHKCSTKTCKQFEFCFNSKRQSKWTKISSWDDQKKVMMTIQLKWLLKKQFLFTHSFTVGSNSTK